VRTPIQIAALVVVSAYAGCMPDFDTLTGGQSGAAGRPSSAGSGGTAAGGKGGATCDGDCAGESAAGMSGEGGMSGSAAGGHGGGKGGTAGSGGSSGRGGGTAGASVGDAGEGGQGTEAGAGGSGGASGSGGLAGSSGGAGRGGEAGGVVVPTIHFDFESNLDNWIPVGMQRPPDVQDAVVHSTDQAHHDTGSLAMQFDGTYTPLDAGDPYYGVVTGVTPPANAIVTLWMYATAPGVMVEVYCQTKPSYEWVSLTNYSATVLAVDAWTQITLVMPDADSFWFGTKLYTPLDITGAVYLDDISW